MNDDLLRQVKRAAAEAGQTFTTFVEESVRERMARPKRARERTTVKLPSFKGSGVQPGVDLNDSAGVLDLMEGTDGPLRR